MPRKTHMYIYVTLHLQEVLAKFVCISFSVTLNSFSSFQFSSDYERIDLCESHQCSLRRLYFGQRNSYSIMTGKVWSPTHGICLHATRCMSNTFRRIWSWAGSVPRLQNNFKFKWSPYKWVAHFLGLKSQPSSYVDLFQHSHRLDVLGECLH